MARKIIDLPLHQDNASILLPWMIGLMLYITLFVLTIALGLSFYIQTKTQENVSQVTLEIPTSVAQNRGAMEQRTLETLKGFPQVLSAYPVSFQQVQGALLPWIEPQKDAQSLLSTLSFPILIDIGFQRETRDDDSQAIFLKEIQRIFPEASLVSHEPLFEHLTRWLRTLEGVAWGSAAIFLSIALLAVVSTVQTGVAIHAPILEILHLMGASEKYISRQFQRQTLKTTLKSFLLAGFLAVITWIFARLLFEGSVFDFPFNQKFYQQLGIIFIFIPLLSAFLIFLTTRLTVIFSLKHSLF